MKLVEKNVISQSEYITHDIAYEPIYSSIDSYAYGGLMLCIQFIRLFSVVGAVKSVDWVIQTELCLNNLIKIDDIAYSSNTIKNGPGSHQRYFKRDAHYAHQAPETKQRIPLCWTIELW